MALRPKPYSLEGSEQWSNVDEMFEILFADVSNGAFFFNDLTLVAGDLLYYDGTRLARLGIGAANTVLRTSGVLPAWDQVVLTTDVLGILPIANGGTAGSATPTNGGVAYGTGSAYAFTAVGTAGQVLTSAGAAAPVWAAASASSGGITGLLTNGDPLNPELVFDSNGDIITVT